MQLAGYSRFQATILPFRRCFFACFNSDELCFEVLDGNLINNPDELDEPASRIIQATNLFANP